MRALPRPVLPAVAFALIIVAWQVLGVALSGPGAVIVPPTTIVGTIRDHWLALLLNTAATLQETLLGLLAGVLAAIVLSVIVDRFRVLGDALHRLALLLYTVPVIAIAAPLVAVLGLGLTSKIVVAAIAAYFPVLVNLTGALRTLDPRIDELGRVLDLGYVRRTLKLRAPSVLPALFAALRVAAPAAFIGAVIAEWMGAESGLGVMLIQAMFDFDVPLLWSTILVATAINGGLVALFAWLGVVLAPWHAANAKASA